jgi:hypothetical protein
MTGILNQSDTPIGQKYRKLRSRKSDQPGPLCQMSCPSSPSYS